MNIETVLKEAMTVTGAMGVALVDAESGMALGSMGGGDWLNLDVAAAGNTEVVRAQSRVIQSIGLGDEIEDILITLGRQYHLIRLLDSHRFTTSTLFLYLVLDRERANLALARHHLKKIEADLMI